MTPCNKKNNVMKRLLYYIAALATVALAGCSKDVEGLDAAASTEREVRFAVSLEQDTRVALDETALTWEEGDMLYLCRVDKMSSTGEYLPLYIDNNTISDDKKCAEFSTYYDLVDGAEYIALSRYAYYNSSNNAYRIYIDDNKYQSESGSDSHIESELLLKSQRFTYDASQQTITALQFTIEQSVLELELTFEAGVTGDYTISQATISSENNNFITDIYLYDDGTLGLKSGSAYDVSNEVTTYLGDQPTISSSESYKLYTSICWLDGSTVSGDFSVSLMTTDGLVTTATMAAKELSDGTIYTKSLTFAKPEENTGEKDTLLAIYEAMGGSSWVSGYYNYAETWEMSNSLSEWDGVELDGSGRVSNIWFESITGMTTSLPYDKLAELTALKSIYIWSCDMPLTLTGIGAVTSLEELSVYNVSGFSGSIPEEFYNLTKLKGIQLADINLTGSLSESIGNLTDLTYLYICDTNMTGSIPSSITNLTSLEEFDMVNNKLDGTIPSGLLAMDIEYLDLSFNNFTSSGNSSLYANQELWNKYAKDILTQNSGYGFDDNFRTVYLEDGEFIFYDNGESTSTYEYFKDNKYTLMVYYSSYNSNSVELFNAAQSAYRAYNSAGLGLITNSGWNSLPSGYIGDVVVEWGDSYTDYTSWAGTYHIIVDSEGKIVSNPYISGDYTFDYESFYSSYDAEPSTTQMNAKLAELFKDADPYFALSSEALTAPSLGGTATLNVLSNTSWSASESSEWITAMSTTQSNGNAEITITFSKNTTGESRSTDITFTNGAGEAVILPVTQGVSMLDDLVDGGGL